MPNFILRNFEKGFSSSFESFGFEITPISFTKLLSSNWTIWFAGFFIPLFIRSFLTKSMNDIEKSKMISKRAFWLDFNDMIWFWLEKFTWERKSFEPQERRFCYWNNLKEYKTRNLGDRRSWRLIKTLERLFLKVFICFLFFLV